MPNRAQRWTNDDGLNIGSGTRDVDQQLGEVRDNNPIQQLVVKFTYDNLPTFNEDSDNDGTDDAFDGTAPYIPEGAFIKSASLLATTDWASGTSLDIGLYTQAGAAIDADGIDAAVAAAALDTGDNVICDGALVGNLTKLVTADGYLVVAATGTFTTGEAVLVIEYIDPSVVA